MNSIKKTILATTAGLALVGGVVLAPLTAHGEPDRAGADRPTSSQQQRPVQQRQVQQRPVQQRQQRPAGDGFTCTKGTKPTPVYGKDGHLTPESARQLLAAGCSANDGSELEEVANPDRHSGKSTPGPGTSKPKTPVGKPGVTQPPTKLPRVAG
ncbi:hypothetical protein ACIPEQ_16325 [Curtobacterium sp. NPDC087080]|uniref:hypothetical protein n=1 Tax=Curtobacterium sp. NPDC087080 TaxID=3363965 RepID=UPI0038107DE5